MSELRLFIPIGKIDEAQRLVYGTLTEETPDKSGEIFDYASGKPAIQAWSDEIKAASKGKSLGNVRAMHGNIAAGKFTDIHYDDAAKRIEGAAKIVDDDEWEKVLSGVYNGFSIGGSYTKRWQDKDNPSIWRYTPKLSEISLVDNPCVPTATFEYIKADGSVEMRKFITHSNKEDSMDPVLLKAAQEADAKGEATDEQKALLAKAAELAKPALVKDGKAVKPSAAPVQKWLATDGTPFDSKREAEIHNLHLEKQAELAPGLAQMDALLKGAKPKDEEDEDEDKDGDDEETKKAKKARREEKAAKAKKEADDAEMAAKAKKEKEEAEKAKKDKDEAEKAVAAAALQKKDYTDKERKEMAGKEAMEDGSFPIKTKKDVKDAVDDWGRAGSKPDVKAHIVARAKAIGAEDALPDDWKAGKKKEKKEKAAPKGKLAKGLHQVGWLAGLLANLQDLQTSVSFEQLREGDKDSELPAKFKSLVAEMCEVLVTLVEEETSELTEGDDTDVEVLEMAAGLPKGHPEAIAKFARLNAIPLVKSDSKKESETGARLIKFAEMMEKAGARHSKADADRVQALHDHADEMHKCMGDMVEKCADMHKAAGEAKNTAIDLGAKGDKVDDEDDMEPASKSAVKMSKVLDELSGSRAETGALTKVIGTMDTTLREAVDVMKGYKASIEKLEQEKSELTKRMEHLEGQPMPGKGHVRVISKAQDSGETGGETEAEYKARLDKMTPGQRARESMKKAMSNPMDLPKL
jgi:phage head maturation protease